VNLALLVASLALWSAALGHSAWLAARAVRRGIVRPRRRLPLRQRRRLRSLRNHPAAHSLRLAGRLYIAVGCSSSLARGLAILVAAEAEGPLRDALQTRLRHLQRRVPAARLPRWLGMPYAPCPPSLRVLDDLLAGRIAQHQAMAQWRIELLCSRVAGCRAYHRGDESLRPAGPPPHIDSTVAGSGSAGAAVRVQQSAGAAHRRHAGASPH
jgi:hypothetical protein